MKNTFTALLLLVQIILLGQTPSYKMGEQIGLTEIAPAKILGEYKDQYLMIGQASFSLATMSDPTALTLKQYNIAYFNKNTLKMEKSLPFADFVGEGTARAKTPSFEDAFFTGDTLQLITSTWDKETKEYLVHGWSLDPLTLKPYVSEAKLLARIATERKNAVKWLSINYFENIKRIGISYLSYERKTENSNITLQLFDTQLKEISKAGLQMSDTKRGTAIGRIAADSRGNIGIVYFVSDKKNAGSDDDVWAHVAIYRKGSDQVQEVEVALEAGNPINGELFLENDKFFLAGNYAFMVDEKTNKVFNGGSYIAQIDPVKGEVLKVQELELTDNQKLGLEASDIDMMQYHREHYFHMARMRPEFKYTDAMGNMTLVSASTYEVWRSSGGRSTNNYYNNSRIVTRYKPDATIAWQVMVPRSAWLAQLNYALSPAITMIDGKLHILFNDHEDNIEPIALMQSGKKLDGKSSSKSKSSSGKAKVQPPTDSDQMAELKKWNLGSAALRHTVIDAQGLWSVDWMRPEGKADDDDSKLPAIEGRTVYVSQSNNKEVLIGAFTKYGALGFRKWAMTKFTF